MFEWFLSEYNLIQFYISLFHLLTKVIQQSYNIKKSYRCIYYMCNQCFYVFYQIKVPFSTWYYYFMVALICVQLIFQHNLNNQAWVSFESELPFSKSTESFFFESTQFSDSFWSIWTAHFQTKLFRAFFSWNILKYFWTQKTICVLDEVNVYIQLKLNLQIYHIIKPFHNLTFALKN